MYNPRSPQRGLWDCDHLYGDYVGEDSFYVFLASQRGKIFKDEDFADLFSTAKIMAARASRPAFWPQLSYFKHIAT